MKSWYSKVRDTELIDGSIRATYVVTFETDSIELKREVEKYLQGIMDRADRKTEPNSSEKPNNCEVKNYCDDCLYTDTCDSKEFFYACTSKATISKMEQVEDEQIASKLTDVGNSMVSAVASTMEQLKSKLKDEPQTDCAWK